MGKKRRSVAFLCGCVAVQALTGCANVDTNEQSKTTQSSAAVDENTSVEIMKNDDLAIDAQKCVGCGKCARIASRNFAMRNDVRKAEVISQEISSQALIVRAVESCPTRAITQ